MKFFVKTLGCKVNTYESASITKQFLDDGHVLSDEENADVIIINTCTVTNQADSKSRKMIRHAKKVNNKAVIVVCGCMAENHHHINDELDIDILIGNKDKSKILLLVKDYLNDKKQIVKFYDLRHTEFEDMDVDSYSDKTRAFVKIQDGCNNFCSYCIIPFVRGNIRSKDINVAYEEIKCLVNNGYKEVVLTGIHTGSYGNNENYDLVDLIKKISSIEDLKRIRISSIEITELDDKFIEEFKNNPKIVSHLHIPIQSGCNRILELMKRKYDIEYFKNKINILRSIRNNLSITTDLIVGFPTETDDDFEETINNLKEIRFSKIHVFPYSKRDNTLASTMILVNDKIKKKRVDEVLNLSDKLENEFYNSFIDKEVIILTEDNLSGLTDNYIKVIMDKKTDVNQLVKVKITSVEGNIVKAKLES